MKSVETIIETRNKLRECVNKINQEIIKIKGDKTWDEILSSDKQLCGQLIGLKQYYSDQIKGINFCLNEDSEIDKYERFVEKYQLEEFMF